MQNYMKTFHFGERVCHRPPRERICRPSTVQDPPRRGGGPAGRHRGPLRPDARLPDLPRAPPPRGEHGAQLGHQQVQLGRRVSRLASRLFGCRGLTRRILRAERSTRRCSSRSISPARSCTTARAARPTESAAVRWMRGRPAAQPRTTCRGPARCGARRSRRARRTGRPLRVPRPRRRADRFPVGVGPLLGRRGGARGVRLALRRRRHLRIVSAHPHESPRRGEFTTDTYRYLPCARHGQPHARARLGRSALPPGPSSRLLRGRP